MKHLLPFLVFFIILSCSSDDDKKKTYKDLSGSWKFSKGHISGTFKITNVNNEYLLIHSGTFTINGNDYTSGFEWEVEVFDSRIAFFSLISADQENYVEFANGIHNEDYTEMSFPIYSFKEECCDLEEFEDMVTLKRK